MKTITRDLARTGKILPKPRLNRRRVSIASLGARSDRYALRLKSLLVPTDYSECSNQALDYAEKMAEQFGAQVELVHVIAPGESPVEYGRGFARNIEALRAERERLDQYAAERL